MKLNVVVSEIDFNHERAGSTSKRPKFGTQGLDYEIELPDTGWVAAMRREALDWLFNCEVTPETPRRQTYRFSGWMKDKSTFGTVTFTAR